ncbi:glycosyltransferase [Gryllotalpicola koreensis]|uniref:Glycosyltransferase 2-like domain-containing protein n=1 Tax=Gryllotalpicola koreensis TaxID=993086 RepID=A0ABP8A269_9MICO
MIALSVLVPSVSSRRDGLAAKVVDQLFAQVEQLEDRKRVEVIVLQDNFTRVVGDKRNILVNLAQGDYVAFVDDDDWVEPDYITSLLAAIDSGDPDAVTFQAAVTLDGGPVTPCDYSIRFTADRNFPDRFERLPNHIAAVRRELALKTPFKEIQWGEDGDYAKRLKPLLKSEVHLEKTLYHYVFDSTVTETQKAVMDVVMMSNASTPDLRRMTQHAIDTCRRGASGKLNIIVVEQDPSASYRGASVIRRPGQFNYNAAANEGARWGRADWIMFANNDLVFEPGWMEPLLNAGHMVVSPHNPGDPRQQGLRGNETGPITGRHLSGWCFMMAREVWNRIGGLNEDYGYWCADNATVKQVMALGIEPMLVPDSRVKHLVSKTGGRAGQIDDELTWGAVARFNAEFGEHLFEGDPRFEAWRSARG